MVPVHSVDSMCCIQLCQRCPGRPLSNSPMTVGRCRFVKPVRRICFACPIPSKKFLLISVSYHVLLVARSIVIFHLKSQRYHPWVGAFPPSYERIMSLKPDVVLMMSGTLSVRQRLEALGVPVVVSQPKTVGDVATVIVRLGMLTGVPSLGAAKAVAFVRPFARPQALSSLKDLWFYECGLDL